MGIFEQFNLPSYLKNKSFAEASKLIQDRFKGRVDKDSLDTQNELLGRLRDAQEYVKAQNEPQQTQQQTQEGTHQMPDGSIMNDSDMQGGDMMGNIMSQANGNQYAYGGATTGDSFQNVLYPNQTPQGQSNKSSSMVGSFGAIGQGLSSAGTGLQQNARAKELEANGGVQDPNQAQTDADNQMIDKTKDTVAEATGPFGKLFRGVQKLGEGIGDTVGGESGAAISGAFSPEAATMANFKDKDLSFGEKLLGTVPGVGAVMAKRQKDKRVSEAKRDNLYAQAAGLSNDFAEGGYTNPWNRQMSTKEDDPNYNPYQGYEGTISDQDFTSSLVQQYNKDNNIAPRTFGPQGGHSMYAKTKNFTEKAVDKGKTAVSDAGTWLNDNKGDILRYAPVAMNALQLARLKKPKQEGLDRINTRYQEQLADESYLQNLVREETNANREAILGASGGSESAARASLLGSQLNSTKALSDAYMRSAEINRNERKTGQQFNLGIDQMNVQQSNLEGDINARNLGNYETQKSKLMAEIGNNLGSIGTEELFKKYPELMGSMYDSKGRFINNKDKDKKKKK